MLEVVGKRNANQAMQRTRDEIDRYGLSKVANR